VTAEPPVVYRPLLSFGTGSEQDCLFFLLLFWYSAAQDLGIPTPAEFLHTIPVLAHTGSALQFGTIEEKSAAIEKL
jgi:hypothetical protein